MTAPAYSVKKVAELLAIRQHGILAMIRSGELKAFDVSLVQGGRAHWRILADDLDSFIRRRTRQPTAPRKRRRRPTNVKAYF